MSLKLMTCCISIRSPFVSRHGVAKPCLFSTTPVFCKRTAISLLKSCKSMRQLKQIHAQVFCFGLHQDGDIHNKLIAFSTDSSVGNFSYAQRVFDYIQERNLFVYNVIIKVFARKGSFRKAVSLFERLKVDGLTPDNYTYPFVLMAIGCMGEAYEAGKVHGFIMKNGVEFDPYVCNSLMDMYAELGKIEYCQKLFEIMPERDKVSWNVVISGYVRCRRYQYAIDLYRKMLLETHVKPDEATVVSTLSACTAIKDLELGKEIHGYITNELNLTATMGNALLDMYSKCGCLSIAREIFEEMTVKNVNCWTTMVSAYVNSGQLDEARGFFERSPVRDIVLWMAMINGYVQFNRFDEAGALFQEMQTKRIKADHYIVAALLTGCAQLGNLEQGKWIHGYIIDNNITVNTVVGTALIEMYAKCGCIEKAFEIFCGLKKKDAASWTSIICGHAMNGKTSKALELFAEMKHLGFRPDDITFIGVLTACSHAGLVKEGRLFFHYMKSLYQIEPKPEHYGCLIDLLSRAGLLDEADALIEDIPKDSIEIIIPLYGALLSACRIHNNVSIGERIAMKLEKIRSTDSSVLMLLANIYASADRWEDVTKVRRMMKDLGIKKVPGCSAIGINGAVHEFLVGNFSHPELEEIRTTLDRLAWPLLGSEENELGGEIFL